MLASATQPAREPREPARDPARDQPVTQHASPNKAVRHAPTLSFLNLVAQAWISTGKLQAASLFRRPLILRRGARSQVAMSQRADLAIGIPVGCRRLRFCMAELGAAE